MLAKKNKLSTKDNLKIIAMDVGRENLNQHQLKLRSTKAT